MFRKCPTDIPAVRNIGFIAHLVDMCCLYLQVTHRLEELEWADTASYMDQGRIQFTGAAKDVAQYMRSQGAR